MWIEDAIAIALALAAAAWLVRGWWRGAVSPPCAPRENLPAGADGLIGQPLEEVEKFYIQKALELTQGNREEAATMLGIGERTLYRKIKRYGFN